MIPLTGEQLDELRVDLAQLKNQLEGLLETTESGTKPVKLKDNAGRLTRMDEMHNQSILKANRNVISNRLRTVQAAIQRIKSDSYGDCVTCGEPVSFARLKAYPDATMCLDCKSELEQS